MAKVTGGSEEMMSLSVEGDVVVAVGETETMYISNESWVIDTKEDGVDKVAGGVIGFKDVDFVIVYIWGVVRNSGGCPQWFGEDRGLGAHGATTKDDRLLSIGEEGKPWCDD